MNLDTSKTAQAVINSGRSTGQTVIDKDGNLKWAMENIYSGEGATQAVTVVSGVAYTIRASSGSVAYSGAATGTLDASAGVARVEVTASTTTLTITPTAATEIAVYRSDLAGMQFDKYGSDYLPNTTGAALYSLGVNYETGVGGMQVWEGRTNLLLDSVALATQSVTTTNVPHTLSFSGTGTVTLSGTSTSGPLVGTGSGDADRVSLTFTPTAGSLTLTVSGAVSFAQLEVGASPSPYIPTFGSTQTRGADNLSTLLSSFGYNVNEGTVVVDWISSFSNAPFSRVFQIGEVSDGKISLELSSTSDVRAYSDATSIFSLGATPSPYTPASAAYAFKENDFAGSLNGGTVALNSAGSLSPLTTRIFYGRSEFAGKGINGEIRKLAYYPTRLSNATLVEAST